MERARARRQWFIDLVRRYEGLAERDPEGYRRRVRTFGWLGYAYVFGVLLLVLAFLAGLVFIMVYRGRGNYLGVKGLIIGAIIAYSIVRALWVKFDPPSGLPVTRDEAPRLYAEVERIAERLDAPKPEEIRIDPALNAAAQQMPRLGIFGWYRNILHLGMPLLLSMSPDEARSVIAHELGHFSGQHGRFGAWAYRLGMTWEQLYENFHKQGGKGSWLFSAFVNWFVPRFNAMSFALRRAQEYEADRAAVQVAGAPSAARALMRLPYLSSHLDRSFWEPLWARTKEADQPPTRAFAEMPKALRNVPAAETLESELSRALGMATDYDDTHPSLADRLRAMGQAPDGTLDRTVVELARPVELSAAEEFFGDALPRVLDRLEEHYRPRIQERWEESHREYRQYQEEIDRLEALRKERPLDEDEEVGYALAVYRVRSPEESEPVLRSLVDRYPENAPGKYLLGELLIERDDEAGVALVQEASRLNPDFADAARRLCGGFYYRRGERDRFEALREEAFEAMTVAGLVEEEAHTMRLADRFLVSEMNDEEREALRTQLETVPTLQVAYAVRKMLPGDAGHQEYLIVFPVRKLLEIGNEGNGLLDLVSQSVTFPRESLIYTDPQLRKDWERKLSQIPGAKVYERKK